MEGSLRLTGLIGSRGALRLGVFIVALAAVWSLRIGAEAQDLIATSGRYVDITVRSSQEGTGIVPIVRFETTDGRIVRFETDVESIAFRLPRERSVSVWYDPADPDAATVDNPAYRHIAPAAVGLIGTTLLVGSVTVGRRARSASE